MFVDQTHWFWSGLVPEPSLSRSPVTLSVLSSTVLDCPPLSSVPEPSMVPKYMIINLKHTFLSEFNLDPLNYSRIRV